MSEWVDYTAPANWQPKLLAVANGDHSGYTPAERMKLCSSSLSVNAGTLNIPNSGVISSTSDGGYTWDGSKWAAASNLLQTAATTNTPVLQLAVLQFAGSVPAGLLGIRITARSQAGFAGAAGDFYDVRLPYAETVTFPYDDPFTDDGGGGNAAGDPGDASKTFTTVFADLNAAYVDNFATDFLTFNGLESFSDLLAAVTAMIVSPDGDNILLDGHDNNLMHITKIEFLVDAGFWVDKVNTEEQA